MELKNKYYLMRHGHPLNHEKGVSSCWPEKFENPLTKKGVEEAETAAQVLKGKNINLIFSSDILRTRETAGIVSAVLGVGVKFDKKLRENNFGVLNGQPREKVREFFGPKGVGRFKMKPYKGEKYSDVEKRVSNFFKKIDRQYEGKNILIVGHELPLLMIKKWVEGVSDEEFFEKVDRDFKTGEILELN